MIGKTKAELRKTADWAGNSGSQDSSSLLKPKWVDLRPWQKKIYFWSWRDLSLLLIVKQLRIKTGGQIRLCFVYTNVSVSLFLEKLVFDLNEWPNPASGLVHCVTCATETWMKFRLGHYRRRNYVEKSRPDFEVGAQWARRVLDQLSLHLPEIWSSV